MLGGELRDHPGADALPEIDERARRYSCRTCQELASSADIARETILGRVPGIRRVTAIVEEQHAKVELADRSSQPCPISPVAAVARCDEHGRAAADCGWQVPGTELESVTRRERDFPGSGQQLRGRAWLTAAQVSNTQPWEALAGRRLS